MLIVCNLFVYASQYLNYFLILFLSSGRCFNIQMYTSWTEWIIIIWQVKSCSINTKQKSRETFITETIHRTKEILRGLLPDSISVPWIISKARTYNCKQATMHRWKTCWYPPSVQNEISQITISYSLSTSTFSYSPFQTLPHKKLGLLWLVFNFCHKLHKLYCIIFKGLFSFSC